MAILTEIADAIVDELNAAARSWSLAFVARRQNVPRLKREDAYALTVTVTPLSKETETITRAKSLDRCRYLVGIQQGLRGDTNDETDRLIALGEEIQAYFDAGTPLTSYPTTVCEETAFGSDAETPWLSVQDNDEALLYTGIIRLTFRVHR